MGAPAAIPAWAIISAIAAKSGGDFMQSYGDSQSKDKLMKQRNREFLANIALKNKELTQQDDQFRELQKLKEKEAVKSGPRSMMETMSMLGQLGRQPASTADVLKYLSL